MSFLKYLFKGKYETYTFKHKGYVLQQTNYNWHYIITEEISGEVRRHAQCTKKLTKVKAQQHIDAYIQEYQKLKGEQNYE